ncbi:MAG TPA: alkaline phosphatase family protein [Thermoplasmata archaeon]|nr:alkaline phosphatase family protein [Thermoplasmata archaeon]
MNALRKHGVVGGLGFAVAVLVLFAPLAASTGGGAHVAPTGPPVTRMLLGTNVVTFQESGLPLLTSWSVTLNGSNSTALAPLSNVFTEANGAYPYTIGTVPGYSASPASGTVTVSSTLVTVKITFKAGAPTTYPVTFAERGLATGTTWSVQMNGTTTSATAPGSVAFDLPNGTYGFVVGAVDGYRAAPGSGNVTVSGSSVATTVVFGAAIQHVVEIVMENEAAATVLSTAPYQSYLASTYAQATHFYGACHYSYPDYAAMTSGRYFACGNASIPVQDVTNIADLLERANLTWAAYFESMSSSCQLASAGSYVSYHNPFILYKDIRYNTSRCDTHDVNSAAFNSSVAQGTLPSFSYYVPNIYDDCYKSSMAFCDNWLKNFLSPILNSTSPAVQKLVASTVFLVVYDEGEETGAAFYAGYSAGGSYVNTWCKNTTGTALSACGGLVYAVAVSPWSAKLHYVGDASDYNLQSTVEWLFKLGNDGGWDGTSAFPAMTGLFTFSQNGQVNASSLPAPLPGATAPAWVFGSAAELPLLGVLVVGTLGLVLGVRRRWTRRAGARSTSSPNRDGPSRGAG